MAGTEQRRLMDAWAPRLHWMTVGLLALLCGVVAVLQYRWIGEISETERDRLEVALRERLAIVQRDFNDELRNAANALIPTEEEIEAEGRDAAYEARMGPARPTLFSRIALAIPEKGDLAVQVFDDRSGKFEAAPWPSLWSRTRDYLRAKLGGPQAAGGEPDPMILEYPRFDAGREQEWLIIELNAKYVREKLLPEIVHRELADYDVQVLARGPDAREAIYSSSEGLQLSDRSDASVTLLESGPGPTRRRGPGGSRGEGAYSTTAATIGRGRRAWAGWRAVAVAGSSPFGVTRSISGTDEAAEPSTLRRIAVADSRDCGGVGAVFAAVGAAGGDAHEFRRERFA